MSLAGQTNHRKRWALTEWHVSASWCSRAHESLDLPNSVKDCSKDKLSWRGQITLLQHVKMSYNCSMPNKFRLISYENAGHCMSSLTTVLCLLWKPMQTWNLRWTSQQPRPLGPCFLTARAPPAGIEAKVSFPLSCSCCNYQNHCLVSWNNLSNFSNGNFVQLQSWKDSCKVLRFFGDTPSIIRWRRWSSFWAWWQHLAQGRNLLFTVTKVNTQIPEIHLHWFLEKGMFVLYSSWPLNSKFEVPRSSPSKHKSSQISALCLLNHMNGEIWWNPVNMLCVRKEIWSLVGKNLASFTCILVRSY